MYWLVYIRVNRVFEPLIEVLRRLLVFAGPYSVFCVPNRVCVRVNGQVRRFDTCSRAHASRFLNMTPVFARGHTKHLTR